MMEVAIPPKLLEEWLDKIVPVLYSREPMKLKVPVRSVDRSISTEVSPTEKDKFPFVEEKVGNSY
jgi:hypothetical protein